MQCRCLIYKRTQKRDSLLQLTGLILLRGRVLASISSPEPSLGGVGTSFEGSKNPFAGLAAPFLVRLSEE